MHRSDDIANLLGRFGASADSYKEIEPSYDYIEELAIDTDVPVISATAEEQAAADKHFASMASEADAVEIVPEPTLVAPARPTLVSVRTSATTALGSLLAEVAQKRLFNPDAHLSAAPHQAEPQPRPRLKAKVIAVVSGKGGVGKTTVAGALASAFKRGEGRTVAVDLDPQNALCLHLGVSAELAGIVQAHPDAENWRQLAHDGFARSQCLSYGIASEEQQRRFEQTLQNDPYWLARRLADMHLGAQDTVIIDTPPGATLYLSQALEVADLVIVVTLPDAASYTSLNQMDRLMAPYLQREPAASVHYVINQLDPGRAFSLDMCEVLKKRAGTQLLGVIHQDHFISESLAYERNPLAHTPSTRGCQDILDIAGSLSELIMQGTTEPTFS